MGNMIYLDKEYIAGVSDEFGAKLHRHPLLEIYASVDGKSSVRFEDGIEEGKIIVIGANTVHAISDSGKQGIALFIDPLTGFGYSLYETVLGSEDRKVIDDISCAVRSSDDITASYIRSMCPSS